MTQGNAEREDVLTATDQTASEQPGPEQETPSLALVVLWSAGEARVGQTLLPPYGDPGPWRLFGRGPAQASDGDARCELSRARPDEVTHAAPLQNPKLSRQQLRLRCLGSEALELQNLGRCALTHRGEQRARCEVTPGELVQLGTQLLLLCVRRPSRPRPLADVYPPFPFGLADDFGMVGESPAIWRLRQRLAFVAPRHEHVLVLGPSGAGKELAAHAIHALSPRGPKPLISRNAATLPEGLIDAELFGTARNFPNAGMPERMGLVGSAHGSTLFLDEFSELPLEMQPHLLRVLDAGEYQRLGDPSVLRSDFRLIAATNRPLETLKHDLAARLPFHVVVPDLNERREDIPLLAAHLLRKLARSDPALARIFPGKNLEASPNVALNTMRTLVERPYQTHLRELQSLLWELIARSNADTSELSGERSLPPSMPPESPASSAPPRAPSVPPPASQSPAAGAPSAAQIQACLDQHNGSIELAWRALGLGNRYALRRLIAKHGLEVRRRPRP